MLRKYHHSLTGSRHLVVPNMQEHIDALLSPEDVAKVIRNSVPKTSMFVRVAAPLYTSYSEHGERRCYDLPELLKVPRKQALELMASYQRFNQVKRNNDQATGAIKISRHDTCLFIG
jgi:hypothetical protein